VEDHMRDITGWEQSSRHEDAKLRLLVDRGIDGRMAVAAVITVGAGAGTIARQHLRASQHAYTAGGGDPGGRERPTGDLAANRTVAVDAAGLDRIDLDLDALTLAGSAQHAARILRPWRVQGGNMYEALSVSF